MLSFLKLASTKTLVFYYPVFALGKTSLFYSLSSWVRGWGANEILGKKIISLESITS